MDINKITANAEKVLEEFNYLAVHKHMVDNNWTWRGVVPDIDKIKVTANYVVHTAVDNLMRDGKAQHVGTGGFNVYIFPDYDGVKLTFEPEELHKESY